MRPGAHWAGNFPLAPFSTACPCQCAPGAPRARGSKPGLRGATSSGAAIAAGWRVPWVLAGWGVPGPRCGRRGGSVLIAAAAVGGLHPSGGTLSREFTIGAILDGVSVSMCPRSAGPGWCRRAAGPGGVSEADCTPRQCAPGALGPGGAAGPLGRVVSLERPYPAPMCPLGPRARGFGRNGRRTGPGWLPGWASPGERLPEWVRRAGRRGPAAPRGPCSVAAAVPA